MGPGCGTLSMGLLLIVLACSLLLLQNTWELKMYEEEKHVSYSSED